MSEEMNKEQVVDVSAGADGAMWLDIYCKQCGFVFDTVPDGTIIPYGAPPCPKCGGEFGVRQYYK